MTALSGMPVEDLARDGMPPGRPTTAQRVIRERLKAIILYLRRRDIASVHDIASALCRSERAVEKLIKPPAPVVRMAPVVAREPEAAPAKSLQPTTRERLFAQSGQVGVVGVVGGAEGLFADGEAAD